MPDGRLWHGGLHRLDSAHRLPIVFVLSRAEEAHLVILAVGSTPGPGELVAAAAKPENVQNLRHSFFTDDDVGDSSDHLTSDRKCVDYFRACYLVPLPCACKSLNRVRLLFFVVSFAAKVGRIWAQHISELQRHATIILAHGVSVDRHCDVGTQS